MAPAVAMKVGACRKSSTPLTLQRAGNLLEGAKRGIGNLVFVTLPPDLLRVLRAGVPGESYVKGCLLLPWHAPGPPAVLPLTHCVPSPARPYGPHPLAALPLPRCAHSPISLAALTQGCAPRGSPIAYATTSLLSFEKTSFSFTSNSNLRLLLFGPNLPRCAHSRLRPQRVPHCSRNYNHIFSSKDLLHFKLYFSKTPFSFLTNLLLTSTTKSLRLTLSSNESTPL